MAYTYSLPKCGTAGSNDNEIDNCSTSSNAVIIIGANGSGKSRLGAWIERQSPTQVHRISAQRNNTINETIQLRNLDRALNYIRYGSEEADKYAHVKISKANLYQNDRWTSYERNDIDFVLSAIFAKRTKQLEEHDENAKLAPNQTLQREANIADEIEEIWKLVFPHRGIVFRDATVLATFNSNEYNGIEMSDGERVALYLIAQALLLPKPNGSEYATVIIDEPEIHLHRSIMNLLWEAIEQARPDCLFVYITHDTQFAANHRVADKVWVKSFDGINWDWELVAGSDLPEQLLLDILGNRNRVIFVEGTADSLDTKLYEAIYKSYYIVPCGSCTEVIVRTKAMNNTTQLNHIKAYGIIDRDFRPQRELDELKSDGVFALSVAEVENLFIVEPILELINRHFEHKDNSEVEKVKNFVIDTKFKNLLSQQIKKATISECKYQLSIIDISETTSDNDFNQAVGSIKYSDIFASAKGKYESALANREYAQILSLFNEKSVSKEAGKLFVGGNDDYCSFVVRLANGKRAADVISAMKSFLPTDIPLPIPDYGVADALK